MKRPLLLAQKEFRDILRERSIILALLVQAFVAAFSAFLTFGLVGLYDPSSAQGRPDVTLAYTGPGGFDAYLRDADNIVVRAYTLDEARQRFADGNVFGVVEEGLYGTDDARTVTFLLPEADLRSTLIVTQLKELLRDYERDLREDRSQRLSTPLLYVDAESGPPTYYGFAYSVLLPMLVLTPVFLAGAITGDALSQELQTRTLHLLRASPLTPAGILIGKLLAPVALVPLQVLLWIGLLALNGIMIEHLAGLLFLSLALGLVMAGASAALAFLVRDESTTQSAYALVVMLAFTASLMIPRDPLNLVARLGAGSMDAASWTTIGLITATAGLVLAIAAWAADRRLRGEVL